MLRSFGSPRTTLGSVPASARNRRIRGLGRCEVLEHSVEAINFLVAAETSPILSNCNRRRERAPSRYSLTMWLLLVHCRRLKRWSLVLGLTRQLDRGCRSVE